MNIDPVMFNALGRFALVHEAHIGSLIAAVAAPRADTTMRGEPDPSNYWGYRVDSGVAIIPMRGALITDGPFIGSMWGATSYEGLRAELRRAADDPKVERIVLAINSPGGMVAGIDGAAAAINDAKAKKPVIAVVEGMAASAAYWLASQADEIVMTPLSEVGSIGVVSMHVDMSAALERAGIDVSLIHSGRYKVDGNPYEPLSEATRADMQAETDRLRLEFARAVAAGRGEKFGADVALATEARMFAASDAVEKGMADKVGSIDSVIPNRGVLSGRAIARRGVSMSKTEGAAGAEVPVISQASHEAAVSQASASAKAEGVKEGAAAERTRIAAILDDEKAKGRESLARHFAFKTDMPADQALAALEATPAASATSSPLSSAMSQHRQANLGPGGERSPAVAAPKMIDTASIYGRRAAAVAKR